MIVDVKVKSACKIDIEEEEAFDILCKTLGMDFILDENIYDYFIKKNEFDENIVCAIQNGCEKVIDERGDLFVALANVAVNIFPNLDFRSASYIYK